MDARSKGKRFKGGLTGVGGRSEMEIPVDLRKMLKQRGYSDEAIKEIWKWYDFPEREGITF
jgi:hypothetical protein